MALRRRCGGAATALRRRCGGAEAAQRRRRGGAEAAQRRRRGGAEAAQRRCRGGAEAAQRRRRDGAEAVQRRRRGGAEAAQRRRRDGAEAVQRRCRGGAEAAQRRRRGGAEAAQRRRRGGAEAAQRRRRGGSEAVQRCRGKCAYRRGIQHAPHRHRTAFPRHDSGGVPAHPCRPRLRSLAAHPVCQDAPYRRADLRERGRVRAPCRERAPPRARRWVGEQPRPATRAAGDRRHRRPGPPAPCYAAREYAADRGGELGADSRVDLRVRVPPPERLGEQGTPPQPGASVLERRALCDQPVPGGEAAARHAHRSESEQLARLVVESGQRVGTGKDGAAFRDFGPAFWRHPGLRGCCAALRRPWSLEPPNGQR